MARLEASPFRPSDIPDLELRRCALSVFASAMTDSSGISVDEESCSVSASFYGAAGTNNHSVAAVAAAARLLRLSEEIRSALPGLGLHGEPVITVTSSEDGAAAPNELADEGRAGSVICDGAIRESLGALCEFEQSGKGWLLTGDGPERLARLERLAGLDWSPFVGRSRQLDLLLCARRDAMVSGMRNPRGHSLHLVAEIVGGMGSGKTRLVDELTSRLLSGPEPPVIISSDAGGMPGPLSAWSALLSSMASSGSESEPAPGSLTRVLGRLASFSGPEASHALQMSLPALEALMRGVPAARAGLREQKLEFGIAVRNMIRALANAPGGLVIILEDLHWMDEASLEILCHAVENTDSGQPVMFVLTTREQAVLPEFRTDCACVRRIDMDPLGTADCVEVARHMLRTAELPPALGSLLASRSGGNPFHLEEIILTMVETGLLKKSGDGWELSSDRIPDLPSSAGELVAWRIGRLGPGILQVLQALSAVDPRFSARVIARISPEKGSDAHVGRALHALRSAWILTNGSPHRLDFRHSLTRTAVHEMLSAEERRSLHANVARVLEDILSGDSGFHAPLLALQWEASGNSSKAMGYVIESAEAAIQRGEQAEAGKWLSKARSILAGLEGMAKEEAEWRIVCSERTLCRLRLDKVGESAALDAIEAAAARRATPDRTSVAEWSRGVYLSESRPRDAEVHFRKSIDAAVSCGRRDLEARSLMALASCDGVRGADEDKIRHLRQSLAIWEELGERNLEVECLASLSAFRGAVEDEEAFDFLRRGIEIARSSGSRLLETKVLGMRAERLLELQRLEEAAEDLSSALLLAETTGDRQTECNITSKLARLEFRRDRLSRARGFIDRALFLARETGDRGAEISNLVSMSRLLQRDGRIDEALDALRGALGTSRVIGFTGYIPRLLLNIGALLHMKGLLAEAAADYEEALSLMRSDEKNLIATVHCNLGYLKSLRLLPAEAAGHYTKALEALEGEPAAALEVSILTNRARNESVLGNLAGAREALDRADTVRKQCGAEQSVIPILATRGFVLMLEGRLDAAVAELDSAVSECMRLGDSGRECGCLSDRGRLKLEKGDMAGAREDFERVQLQMGGSGDPMLESDTLTGLAECALLQEGDREAAQALLDRALMLPGLELSPMAVAFCLLKASWVLLRMNRPAEALLERLPDPLPFVFDLNARLLRAASRALAGKVGEARQEMAGVMAEAAAVGLGPGGHFLRDFMLLDVFTEGAAPQGEALDLARETGGAK